MGDIGVVLAGVVGIALFSFTAFFLVGALFLHVEQRTKERKNESKVQKGPGSED